MDELEQSADLPNSDPAVPANSEHDHDDSQHEPNGDDTDLDADGDQPEEEEEIEVDGKKFALPKSAAEKLKAERLMQADYTRKTQEVADQRKAVDAERVQVQRHQQEAQQYLAEVAEVVSIDKQLAAYSTLNWQELIASDPVQAMQLQQQQRALESQRAQAVSTLTQKQQQQALAEQQNTAKQVQEAEAYVRREIPSWTPERTGQINAFAETQGLKMAPEVARLMIQNPALFKIMHKAELYDQLEKKGAKPKAPAAPPAPVTRVGAVRATATKDPDKMSMDDWAKWRNEQRRKR